MGVKERILLVDDDADFVSSTTDLLEAHGYEVLSASTGAQGFDLAKRQRPNLMVLDVMMATKTEGFEVARKIPNTPELRSMPVLLVTGIRNEMKLGFRLEPDETWLPVSRIMEKPIDPAMFIAAVSELLRQRGEMDMQHGVPKLVKDMLSSKEQVLWTVKPETTIYQAVEMMDKYRVSSVLVVQGEPKKLLGICTERDCIRHVVLHNREARSTPVSDAMTAHPICVSPSQTVEECMSLMTHKRVRHLPVLDGQKLVGIISIGDVVRASLADKNFLIDQLQNYITAG
jgi:DNA-binding response OmpR family regulator